MKLDYIKSWWPVLVLLAVSITISGCAQIDPQSNDGQLSLYGMPPPHLSVNNLSTDGWLTYTHEQIGFSLEYPPDWKVDFDNMITSTPSVDFYVAQEKDPRIVLKFERAGYLEKIKNNPYFKNAPRSVFVKDNTIIANKCEETIKSIHTGIKDCFKYQGSIPSYLETQAISVPLFFSRNYILSREHEIWPTAKLIVDLSDDMMSRTVRMRVNERAANLDEKYKFELTRIIYLDEIFKYELTGEQIFNDQVAEKMVESLRFF